MLFVAACWLTWVNFSVALPRSKWQQAIWSPDIDIIEQMVFTIACCPGWRYRYWSAPGWALVGVLFQQVLRNPLAEPTTLGVATGAQLALRLPLRCGLFPGALTTQFAALAGACVVRALVFGVARAKRLSPVTLILAGLVVSLYCGRLTS